MDLKTFKPNGLRTESVIDEVRVNEQALHSLLEAYISIGNMLDQIKKNAYYGKPYDLLKWSDHKAKARQALTQLDDLSPVEGHTAIDTNTRLFHGIIGMCTESTELVEALTQALASAADGKEIDWVNVGEEIGDCNWYENIILDELDLEWESVLDTVINKLKARFPDKFTSEDAINRDTDHERTILEKGLS